MGVKGLADEGSAKGRNTVKVPPLRRSNQNTMNATSAAITCVRTERLEFFTVRGRREASSGVCSCASPVGSAASPSLFRLFSFGETGTAVWGEMGSDIMSYGN